MWGSHESTGSLSSLLNVSSWWAARGREGEAVPGSTPRHWAIPRLLLGVWKAQSCQPMGLGALADGPVFPRANGRVEGSDLIKEGGELSHTFKIIV